MKPESIVTSLEWSKKLEEAGWPRNEAVHWWFFSESKLEGSEHHDRDKSYIQGFSEPRIEHDTFRRGTLAAPTAEEILRRLPDSVDMRSEWPDERTGKHFNAGASLTFKRYPKHDEDSGNYAVYYGSQFEPGTIGYFKEKSFADALAAMYCYLAEQKLLPAA